MRKLRTSSEVIDFLGGPTATGKLTGRKVNAVTNWRATNQLPSATFLVLTQALRERGAVAPVSLWGIEEPERVAS